MISSVAGEVEISSDLFFFLCFFFCFLVFFFPPFHCRDFCRRIGDQFLWIFVLRKSELAVD